MIEELIKYDTNFNEAAFKSYTDNIFIKLFTAVMLDELETVKHFLSDNVYLEYKDKIDNLKTNKKTQIYDELNVKQSKITNIEITEEEFRITVDLTARYMDYLIDSDTGNFISGNNTSRISKDYQLIYVKKRTFLQQGAIRKCSGCGVSLSINTSGKCEYCGTIYNLEKYDYILNSITCLN